MSHRMFDDDTPPIDVRIASGLKKAFAPPHGNDDLFRPVLEALAHVRREDGQSEDGQSGDQAGEVLPAA